MAFEKGVTEKELNAQAEKLLSQAVRELEDRPPPPQPPPMKPFDIAKEDVSPPARFKPFDRTNKDPEAMTTNEKNNIPTGTILYRETTTPRRIYFKTPSALYRLRASDGGTGHTHDIDFIAV